jgi:hypothetical protein
LPKSPLLLISEQLPANASLRGTAVYDTIIEKLVNMSRILRICCTR